MEDTIRTKLTERGCVVVKINDSDDAVKCTVTYICTCKKGETTKKWSVAKGISDCDECLSEKKRSANDEKIRKTGEAKGFTNIGVERIAKGSKIRPFVKFTCKCGNVDGVSSAEFCKESFVNCAKCAKETNVPETVKKTPDMIIAEIGAVKGFTNVKPIHKRENGKSRITVEFICSCGGNIREVKVETFKKDSFAGCDNCSKKTKSKNIKAAIGIKEEDIRNFLTDSGCDFIEIVSGNNTKSYVIKYNCECCEECQKTWISIKNNPYCDKCMKQKLLEKKDEEIKKLLIEKGHTFVSAKREGEKDRIMVEFVCKCGKPKISQWDIIIRDGFGGCEECAREISTKKMKETSNTPEYKEKIAKSNMDKYGVKTTFQVPEVKDKIKQTMLQNYGVENPSQSVEIKAKKRETTQLHYGVDSPLQSAEIRDKIKQTMLQKYGVENPSQLDDIKIKKIETSMKNYGVEFPSQSDEIKEKIKNTLFEKYGYESHFQSSDMHMKQQIFKEYKFSSGRIAKYQGYEHFALDYLTNILHENEDNIFTCYDLCINEEMPEFWYNTQDGKAHRYFPDIYVCSSEFKGTFIEIKAVNEFHSAYLDLKINSVLQKGYSILLWRFDTDGNLVENKKYN